MRIINYSYGYEPIFDCFIHGKIIMTAREWTRAKRYLLNNAVIKKLIRFNGGYDNGFRYRLKSDMARGRKAKGEYRINVRVPATEAIVNHFGLTGYKRGNYMIAIKK